MHEGSLYVAGRREAWFDGGTLTGRANDPHGPCLGPGALFYWTKRAVAEQTLTLKIGAKLTTRAAHVSRATRDATGIEVVTTGPSDYPVGLALLPTGEALCAGPFALHLAYGEGYGKDHAAVRNQPWADAAPSGRCTDRSHTSAPTPGRGLPGTCSARRLTSPESAGAS